MINDEWSMLNGHSSLTTMANTKNTEILEQTEWWVHTEVVANMQWSTIKD